MSTPFKEYQRCCQGPGTGPGHRSRQAHGRQRLFTGPADYPVTGLWGPRACQVCRLSLTDYLSVLHFYNGRGTAEQWIKEGKYALNWTRLSCHRFVANQVRLWLFILAYNLGNFLRRLCLPKAVKYWSLRSLQAKLIKIGGRLVRHARRLVFQLAEVAVPREVFRQVLERIGRLRPVPV